MLLLWYECFSFCFHIFLFALLNGKTAACDFSPQLWPQTAWRVFAGAFTIRRRKKKKYFSPFHSRFFLSWHPDMKEPRVVICIFTPERVFQVGIEILRAPSIPSAAVSSGLSVLLFIFDLPRLCFCSQNHRSSPCFPSIPPPHPPALFHLSLHYKKNFIFVDLFFDLIWKCL